VSAPIAFFHAVGYLKVPDLVDADECAHLRDVTDQIAELSVAGNVTRRPDRTRIDQAVSMHSAILAVATSDRLVSVLESVLGPNIELLENRHNQPQHLPPAGHRPAAPRHPPVEQEHLDRAGLPV
jgi:hypothetical protein